jgi:hypothetical protein
VALTTRYTFEYQIKCCFAEANVRCMIVWCPTTTITLKLCLLLEAAWPPKLTQQQILIIEVYWILFGWNSWQWLMINDVHLCLSIVVTSSPVAVPVLHLLSCMFTLRWLWVLILRIHQWTPTHAAVFKGGVNKTVKCNNYLWSVLRKNGLDVSCLWHTTEWTQKVLNDAFVWIYVMMFVLEPIHMLSNLTTYTYHNQSMAWHITYTIEACISQSICNDLCWFAMVPRRLIVMYVLWNGLLFPMPAWPGCWSQPEGWYYVSITV